MDRIFATLCVGAGLLAVSGQARADLIVNGSFETAANGYSLPTGNGTELSAGSTAMLGWTVIGSNTITWFDNENSDSVSTPYGNYFLDLTGATDTPPYGGVTQTISTVAGIGYAMTFAVGVNQTNYWEAGPVSVTASAGATSGTFTANPPGSGNQWATETLDFTATSASTVVSISGLSGYDSIGLDDVSVIQVPEPPSVLMLGPVVLGLGIGLRRLRAQQPSA